jgi:hypothetical protein
LKELERTLIDFYIKTGTITGEMATRNIERQLKRNSPFFSEIWTNFVLRTFAPIVASKIVTIKQTLIGDISKLIIEYIDLNLDIVDIAGAITDFVNEPTFYKWQGMRIARTETTIAMNTATNLAGQESGVALDKEWISAGDGNERESHAEMSGIRVDQNDPFPNGLMYPGDESGEASEVINCRCTFLQIPKRTQEVVINEPKVNYTGDANFIEEYGEEVERSLRELNLDKDVNVVFKKMYNGLGGSVAFDKQADGTYIMGNVLEINTLSNKAFTKQMIRHEMRHIYQSQKKGFMIKEGHFYYEGQKNISVKQYNTILKGAEKGNKEAIKKYLNLPWEVDADNFAGIVRNKTFITLELELVDLIPLPKELLN